MNNNYSEKWLRWFKKKAAFPVEEHSELSEYYSLAAFIEIYNDTLILSANLILFFLHASSFVTKILYYHNLFQNT